MGKLQIAGVLRRLQLYFSACGGGAGVQKSAMAIVTAEVVDSRVRLVTKTSRLSGQSGGMATAPNGRLIALNLEFHMYFHANKHTLKEDGYD
jgi:hypothetical protein